MHYDNLTQKREFLNFQKLIMIKLVSKVINGGKHNEIFWSKYFPEAHQ